MTSVVKYDQSKNAAMNFEFEQRKDFVFFKVNHRKFAIFNKDCHFSRFNFRAADYNVIILGSIEVEDLIKIEAAHTVVMGKLVSNKGSVDVRANGKLVVLGGEVACSKTAPRATTALKGSNGVYISGIYTAHKGEILELFHQAIAQKNCEKLALGLKGTVQAIVNPDVEPIQLDKAPPLQNEEGKK